MDNNKRKPYYVKGEKIMTNMEAKLNEMELRLNEMDELTQTMAKVIKLLAEQVKINAETVLDANTNNLKLANFLAGEQVEETKPVEEKKYLTWGEFTIHPKHKCPILELRVVDGKTAEVFGYMSPFRGYFFQISKSFDGDHTLGSYRPYGGATMKDTFRTCTDTQKCAIYRAMMFSTVLECLTNNYGKDLHPDTRFTSELLDDRIDKFIQASIDWVDGLR